MRISNKVYYQAITNRRNNFQVKFQPETSRRGQEVTRKYLPCLKTNFFFLCESSEQTPSELRPIKLMRNSTLSQVMETKANFWKYSFIYSQTIQEIY
jgi:hypothetical protein